MLKDREFYFSDPNHLNDPMDCQIEICSALKSAVEIAQNENPTVKKKLQMFGKLEKHYTHIESSVKKSGIFSLSKEENNVLMWSHYADNHKGFSLGFALSNTFTEYNESNVILGTDEVYYAENNPFVDHFLEFAKCTQIPEWEEF
jgi:hypothetical protein